MCITFKANQMEPNEGILQHQRKRKMELKCLELEELLQEQGYKEEEIAEKVSRELQWKLSALNQ